MNISFAPKDEAYIRQMVEEGFYSNATELVRDAVRRMREASVSKGEYDNPMYEAVMKAERNLANGAPLTRYNSALMEQLLQEASESAAGGEQASPDVVPR